MSEMREVNHQPWPEVDPPTGWKKNPHAGQRLSWILILTVIIAGGVTALSAGRSEVLPAICFVALVALPWFSLLLSLPAMLTVKAPRARIFSTVLCSGLRHMESSVSSLMPPQAAFMALGVPSAP